MGFASILVVVWSQLLWIVSESKFQFPTLPNFFQFTTLSFFFALNFNLYFLTFYWHKISILGGKVGCVFHKVKIKGQKRKWRKLKGKYGGRNTGYRGCFGFDSDGWEIFHQRINLEIFSMNWNYLNYNGKEIPACDHVLMNGTSYL